MHLETVFMSSVQCEEELFHDFVFYTMMNH